MDLGTRLARIASSREPEDTEPDRWERPNDPPLESLIDGAWLASATSRCFVAERAYPIEHGDACLADLHCVPAEVWSPFLVGDSRRPFDLRQAVFLDIETTGLARGGGTYAFLVGLGFLREDGLLVRQYFMPDYADEEALLDLVAGDLAKVGGLISFNGRSFDWPIIESRYVLARRVPPCDGTPHLDLLHLARRLWRRTLPSCALGYLERAVLGISRDTDAQGACHDAQGTRIVDVPSYLIPQLYEEYVRWGRTQPMANVFYHNAMDVAAMASLAATIGPLVAGGAAQDRRAQAPQGSRHGRNGHASVCDDLSLGILYESVGRNEEAERAYRLAAEHQAREGTTCEALKRLSFLLKRLGHYDEAMHIWQAQLGRGEVYPYIELAKQLEHRLHDYAQAQETIRKAMHWVSQRSTPLRGAERQRLLKELGERLARVERRLQRAEAQRSN